ncbi:transposase [Ramlibacter sp. AN1133]|uniref:transposase n=1 Tax=Ramlibacter sp. AN1133 TaxID=3133429 RepID=UPI0030BBAB90
MPRRRSQGPAAVVDYLARYTHRTAVGNERLIAIDGDAVQPRVRKDKGKRGCVSIAGIDFVARLLQHVLPPGFKRIRHYGVLAPAAKRQRLAAARFLLRMPAPNPIAWEDASAFMRRIATTEISRCAHCANGHWIVLGELRADRRALAREPPANRGPP